MSAQRDGSSIPQAPGLARAVELAHKIYRRIAIKHDPPPVVGLTRSERSDVLDTAELLVRVDGRPYVIEIREIKL